jgi:hypothetical protein
MTINNTDKRDYLVRMLDRTRNKKYENYVITRIWHKLDRLDVKPITQQYVVRPNHGYALVDLFFPQIGMFFEIDEPFHDNKINIGNDKIREMDVIQVTNNQVIRIQVADHDIETINRVIDDSVRKIRNRIRNKSHSFIPWNMEEENDPQTYIKRGKISLKENVSFKRSVDACNCFGHKFKSIRRGWARHPTKRDTIIAFPKLYPHGSVIREKNTDSKKNSNHIQQLLNDPRNHRIVFAQGKDSLGIMRYRFKGVFKLNTNKTKNEHSAIWEKISDEVETIKPA